jgi:hypothetical protein
MGCLQFYDVQLLLFGHYVVDIRLQQRISLDELCAKGPLHGRFDLGPAARSYAATFRWIQRAEYKD